METIGISTAVGTVLGASTLPFYDRPTEHIKNMAYGAGIGAVVGLGAVIFGQFQGSSSDEFGDAEYKMHHKPLHFLELHKLANLKSRPDFVYPALAWMPLVSVNW